MVLVNLIAKPPGLRTIPPQRHRAHGGRTEKKNENFKVEFTRMLYVGIIDLMIITTVYGRQPWCKRAQKESRVNFKFLKFYYFFFSSLRAFSVNSVSLW